jgi:transcriptional regulator with XRE-family HTH domain
MNLETRSDNRTPPVVGRLLRDWRMTRGLSQMDLAEHSGFSARHVSFIETGKTQPSRHALLVLAESLDLPLRERNRLLEAGGFARVFAETPLAAHEMAQVRSVLQFILDRHTPYAAVVLDRHSNCLMGNRAAGQIMARLVEPHLLPNGANMLRAVFHPDGMRRWVVNWPEVGGHLLDRAEREMGFDASDAAGAALLEELRRYADFPQPADRAPHVRPGDLLLPIHIRKDQLELRLFSTIMTLGTPHDVTLQELRIETLFPADQHSERQWQLLGQDPASAVAVSSNRA